MCIAAGARGCQRGAKGGGEKRFSRASALVRLMKRDPANLMFFIAKEQSFVDRAPPAPR